MFKFYVTLAGHEKFSDSGRVTTCRLEFESPIIINKGTKTNGPFENMSFSKKPFVTGPYSIANFGGRVFHGVVCSKLKVYFIFVVEVLERFSRETQVFERSVSFCTFCF